MKKFLKHLKIMGITELRRYFRWKIRIFWDIFGSFIEFIGFLVVWTAILEGGFQGLGMMTKDNYITFILTGSLLWTVIESCFGRMSYSFVREKHRKTLIYLMISPLNRISYLYGTLSQPLLQVFLRNTPVLIVASLIGFVFHGSIFLALIIFILTFLAFSGIGIILAALAAWKEGFRQAAWVIARSLYIISGVYYPLAVFPEPFRGVFRMLPTTQAIDALRKVGLQGAGLAEVSGALIYLAIVAVISISIGLWVFKRMAKKAMYLGI